ncbi:hypothetical protein ACEPAG_9418 [Sanghuangporus baumii]
MTFDMQGQIPDFSTAGSDSSEMQQNSMFYVYKELPTNHQGQEMQTLNVFGKSAL